MYDIVGKPLRNRAIVIFNSFELGGWTYGVIDQINDCTVKINCVLSAEGAIIIEYIREPEKVLLQVRHSQLPTVIKERLIELSKVRLQ